MNPPVLFIVSLLAALSATAQTFIPPAQKEKATPGDALLTDYFRNETAMLSAQCLADLKSLKDWTSRRDDYRRQLQEMLGILPMPERTDLKANVTGRLTHDEFTVEKIEFQASPGLYCTASLFIPRNLTNRAPTILYRCGHWKLVKDGISYGNKAAYQMDGAWFARNGYVCLVLDTLLAGEIQGIHTGTRDFGQWWWNSRGYTPAGVETWFGIRALDYLCTRAEVDTNRFGITGHSGGGAYSWTLTALDDRIKAAAPLAGMTDLEHHVTRNHMDSHCDCNFQVNFHRWDFPQLAALAAPRPLLLGSTDNDGLFPLDGNVTLRDSLQRIYQLYNATTNFAFAIAPGPHDEVPELRLAVLRWFNKHLKGITKANEPPIMMDAKTFFTPEELKVFSTLPKDAINTNIADTFVPLAKSQKRTADELRMELLAKVFAGWPEMSASLEPKRALSKESAGVRFSAWDFTSQHDVPLRLYIFERPDNPGTNVVLKVLNETNWTNWLGPASVFFGETLTNELELSPLARAIDWSGPNPFVPQPGTALAFVAPRGVGLTAWSGDAKRGSRIRRRFMALGQTQDSMRVWDIRRAIQTLHYVRPDDKARVELAADGTMAVNALYAALFESNVRSLDLKSLPKSHAEGPDYLGVLKVTDIPQVKEAVAAKADWKVN
jgi:hypothetical protein